MDEDQWDKNKKVAKGACSMEKEPQKKIAATRLEVEADEQGHRMDLFHQQMESTSWAGGGSDMEIGNQNQVNKLLRNPLFPTTFLVDF